MDTKIHKQEIAFNVKNNAPLKKGEATGFSYREEANGESA